MLWNTKNCYEEFKFRRSSVAWAFHFVTVICFLVLQKPFPIFEIRNQLKTIAFVSNVNISCRNMINIWDYCNYISLFSSNRLIWKSWDILTLKYVSVWLCIAVQVRFKIFHHKRNRYISRDCLNFHPLQISFL